MHASTAKYSQVTHEHSLHVHAGKIWGESGEVVNVGGASVRTASDKWLAPGLVILRIVVVCATCTVYLNHRQQFQHVHGNQATTGHWTEQGASFGSSPL